MTPERRVGGRGILTWDDTEDTKHMSSGDQAGTWRESWKERGGGSEGRKRYRRGLEADLLFSSVMLRCVLVSADKNFLKLF